MQKERKRENNQEIKAETNETKEIEREKGRKQNNRKKERHIKRVRNK